jgi:hypothetical protein
MPFPTPRYEERPDILSLGVILYLVLPICLFIVGWMNVWAIVLLGGCVAVALLPILRRPDANDIDRPIWIFCLVLALSIALASGFSPFVESLTYLDIAKHRWLLNDLTDRQWPVVFEQRKAGDVILRYSFGFYLLPALLGKATGFSAHGWAVLYLGLGLWLFLLVVARQAKTRAFLYILPVLAVAAGGMDIVGFYMEQGWLPLRGFIENWSYMPHGWLIGSTIFNLSWSPQHALPALLGAALIFESYDKAWFQTSSGLLVAASAIWSPFVAFSFAVICLLLFAGSPRRFEILRRLLKPETAIPALLLIAAVVTFLMTGTTRLRSHATIGSEPLQVYLPRYLLFISIEFGLLGLGIWALSRTQHPSFYAAIVLMLVLPLYFFGEGNDLMMRGTMLPSALLIFALAYSLQNGRRRWPLLVLLPCLLLGAWTSFGEGVRLLGADRPEGDFNQSIRAMPRLYKPQYEATIRHDAWLARVLDLK